MGQSLGQDQRFLTPLRGLRRIAQAPQRHRLQGHAPHPGHHAVVEHQGLLRRRVGEGDPLLQMLSCSGVITQEEQGSPKGVMGLQAGRR